MSSSYNFHVTPIYVIQCLTGAGACVYANPLGACYLLAFKSRVIYSTQSICQDINSLRPNKCVGKLTNID